ncbi:MAG: hypothetical protein KDC34_15085 [Saprospiraceae bacterium]|nr:hypothetical protein [Saprospiraceae bacterium]
MKRFIPVLILLLPSLFQAQSVLINSSFEGTPQDATMPVGWFGCQEGTTPDILPGFWGVYTEASEGETYVGLITREDGTFESIGQRLSAPLKAAECYELTLDLALSKTYTGYNNPLKIRVWGGSGKCGKQQLLAESDVINHADWKTYSFSFSPTTTVNYITIEAFYKEGRFSYKGNILVDFIRPIDVCDRAYLD